MSLLKDLPTLRGRGKPNREERRRTGKTHLKRKSTPGGLVAKRSSLRRFAFEKDEDEEEEEEEESEIPWAEDPDEKEVAYPDKPRTVWDIVKEVGVMMFEASLSAMAYVVYRFFTKRRFAL